MKKTWKGDTTNTKEGKSNDNTINGRDSITGNNFENKYGYNSNSKEQEARRLDYRLHLPKEERGKIQRGRNVETITNTKGEIGYDEVQ